MSASMQNPFADDPCLREQARLAALRYRRRLPSATVGERYQSLLSDQPEVRLLAGTRLPPGVHFEDGLGLIGSPAAAGNYVVEFEERPAGGVRRWLLEVADAPRVEIAREPLPAASVGSYLCTHMHLSVPSLPAVWSVSDGRLPPGLRLDAHSGRLYGIPTQAGVWCCSLHARLGTSTALAPPGGGREPRDDARPGATDIRPGPARGDPPAPPGMRHRLRVPLDRRPRPAPESPRPGCSMSGNR